MASVSTATQPLAPSIRQLVTAKPAPNARWTTPVLTGNRLLFSDGTTLYGYSASGNLLWTVGATNSISGWALDYGNLYIQDGCILTQYDLEALQDQSSDGSQVGALPDSAFNLSSHKYWSSQLGPSPYSDFAKNSLSNLRYSAPVVSRVRDRDALIFVLSSEGTICAFPANLLLKPQNVSRIADMPDEVALFQGFDTSGPLLFFLSGKQVVALQANAKPTVHSRNQPPFAPDRWLRAMRIPAGPEAPFTQLWNTGADCNIWCSLPKDDDDNSVPCLTWSHPGWPAANGVAIAFPEKNNVQLEGGSVPSKILAGACLVRLDDARLAYVLTQSDNGVWLEEFKLPQKANQPAAKVLLQVFGGELALAHKWANTGGLGTPAPFDSSSDAGLVSAASIIAGATVQWSEFSGLFQLLRKWGVMGASAVAAVKDVTTPDSDPRDQAILSSMYHAGYPLEEILPLLEKSEGKPPTTGTVTIPVRLISDAEIARLFRLMHDSGISEGDAKAVIEKWRSQRIRNHMGHW